MNFVQVEFANNSIEPPDTHDDLLASGLLDSLGMMRLIRFIEQKFKLQIPFEDMTVENFSTVNKITEYLSKLE